MIPGIRRTVASDLTLWLSVITSIIAVVFGLFFYLYAAQSVSRKLTMDAQQTAEEISRILALPLFNYDQTGTRSAADTYLASGRISGIHIDAEGVGEIFSSISSVSSSLPAISKSITRNGLLLGRVHLTFDDAPVTVVKKQTIKLTLFTVAVILLIYIVCLRFILKRILVTPLTKMSSHLKEIANGKYEDRMVPLPQEDLNTIVVAANKMSDEIESKTRTQIENERNYREIYNATSDAIFVRDAEDGFIVDVNQTMLDMYGYKRDEVYSLTILDLSHGEPPYSSREADELFRKVVLEGPQLYKWYAKRKDGTLFWAEVAMKKTIIGGQEVILSLVRDRSKREQLESKLRQSQKMESIGTLAGGIAHDFNNILSAILGYTELIQLKTDKSSNIYNNLQQVELAAIRARDLVKQILTFSRKQQPHKQVLQLSTIVTEAVTLFRSSIPATVTIELKVESEATVEVDPGQIHQVIMNLCTNAFQSLEKGSGKVIVSLANTFFDQFDVDGAIELEAGAYVVLEVSDNGVGMDEEIRKKIFEPYYTTKALDKGTGLGLAMVHGIVKTHHGQVTVYSEPGMGTTFRVFLPVSDHEKITITHITPVYTPPGNKRIMVVDDEESICELVRQILVHGGYRVDVFADGRAAWTALSAEPALWDMIITDLTMPEMTGLELAGRVSRLRPDLPVILCTGYGEMINTATVEETAIKTILKKPVKMRELLNVTAQVLREN